MHKWYNLQASFYKLLWGRLPVLTRVYITRPDRTIAWYHRWVGRGECICVDGEWMILPGVGMLGFCFWRVGPFVVPTLVYGVNLVSLDVPDLRWFLTAGELGIPLDSFLDEVDE